MAPLCGTYRSEPKCFSEHKMPLTVMNTRHKPHTLMVFSTLHMLNWYCLNNSYTSCCGLNIGWPSHVLLLLLVVRHSKIWIQVSVICCHTLRFILFHRFQMMVANGSSCVVDNPCNITNTVDYKLILRFFFYFMPIVPCLPYINHNREIKGNVHFIVTVIDEYHTNRWTMDASIV